MSAWEQIDTPAAERHRQLGAIAATPAELEARHGIAFELVGDLIDDYHRAIVRAGDVEFALYRHGRTSQPGTIVYVDDAVDDDQARDALGEPLLKAEG